MARRKQFIQLVYDLRAELGRAVDPAAGVSDLPSLKQTIARTYETLYDDYDWPHLAVVTDRVPLNAGQRFYDFPDPVEFDGVEEAVVWYNGQPLKLERGIGFEHYAAFDSDADERSDPALRWDVRHTGLREQMEIWPVPASAQQVQFKGKIKFKPLVDEADVCLLDDNLVVLYAAVELLPRQKSGDAQIKLAAAQQRLAKMKARSKGGSTTIRIGLGGASGAPVSTRSVVRVGR